MLINLSAELQSSSLTELQLVLASFSLLQTSVKDPASITSLSNRTTSLASTYLHCSPASPSLKTRPPSLALHYVPVTSPGRAHNRPAPQQPLLLSLETLTCRPVPAPSGPGLLPALPLPPSLPEAPTKLKNNHCCLSL